MTPLRQTLLVFSAVLVGIAAFTWRPASRQSAPSNDKSSELKAAFQRPDRIPFPSYNPYSEEKYQLGKLLFFDPRLSKSRTISCASCHNSSLSWTDGLARGIGEAHTNLGRRVPTILNLAWGWSFFWDGRAKTLEDQALGPIQAEAEMNMKLPEAIARLESVPDYRSLFDQAFPGQPISGETIGKAIATYERTIVSDIAPFDRWVAGKENAISPSAKRGFALFNEKAACVRCHTGWNFTNGSYADTGLPSTDEGRGKFETNKYLKFTFKTPTLRNISRRHYYMHDGSLTSLRDVVEDYDVGGRVKRVTSELFLKPLKLTEREKSDLLSFLETLTSEDEVVATPSLPGERKGEKWASIISPR